MSTSYPTTDVNAIKLHTNTLDISGSLITPVIKTNTVYSLATDNNLNIMTNAPNATLHIGNASSTVKIRGNLDMRNIGDFQMNGFLNQL